MERKSKSYSLYLNSTLGSPYLQSRPSANDVTYLINWDSVFNLNNHKFTKCKLRYEFSSASNYATNPLNPQSQAGVLVINGIQSKSQSPTGGVVLGLIDLASTSMTNNVSTNKSIASNNFIGTIGAASTTLTVSSTSSPTVLLAVGDSIQYWDTNTSAIVTRTVTAVTGSYTYTLSTANGVAANTSIPMNIANPVTTAFTYMRSSTLMSPEGLSIEVPRGLRNFEVMLALNSYGSTNGQQLITGSSLQDWGLIMHFEMYDPVPNNHTYSQ